VSFLISQFTARNQLSTLLEFLWQLPAHKAKLIEVAADTSSGSIFTRFVNGLANGQCVGSNEFKRQFECTIVNAFIALPLTFLLLLCSVLFLLQI